MTIEERRSTNLHTPRKLDKRVRVSAPDGTALGATIEFEDGEPVGAVLRAVIAIKAGDLTMVFITRWNHEIGKVVYEETECLVG